MCDKYMSAEFNRVNWHILDNKVLAFSFNSGKWVLEGTEDLPKHVPKTTMNNVVLL
jgi:TATA-box binding protein (TBP) (component of TFIID and TFIIIB)